MAIDFDREMKRQQVEEKVYQCVLRETEDVSEEERRYLLTAAALRILEGVQFSARVPLMHGDLMRELQRK